MLFTKKAFKKAIMKMQQMQINYEPSRIQQDIPNYKICNGAFLYPEKILYCKCT